MTLPPQPFGFVAGRWVLSIGDTPDDPDRAPDYVPVPKGKITFTPALSHRVVPDPTTHPGGWTGIIKRPVVGTLGPQGQLIDGEGHDFIALPLGTYSVSYDFEGTPWPSHYLEVTAESTVEAPLWLPTKSPLPTGPGVVQVVTEETRIAAEAAAARAEVAADSAWLAVDTPGRQGPQGIQGPQGPPGEVTTAALTTALAGKVTGTGMTVRVDTTVGTRVLLDHPNGTVMLSGDTGWRDVSGVLSAGNFDLTAPDTYARARRIGDQIDLQIRANLGTNRIGSNRNGLVAIWAPPAGYVPRHAYGLRGTVTAATSTAVPIALGTVGSFANPTRIEMTSPAATGTWAATDFIQINASWATAQAWPSTALGNPA